jgi:hypothetical protein
MSKSKPTPLASLQVAPTDEFTLALQRKELAKIDKLHKYLLSIRKQRNILRKAA